MSNDLPPLPADEGSEPVAGRVKPTASSVDAEVGGVEPEENVGFPWLLVVSLALTLVGMWKMSSEGWSLGDFLGIVFFGFCSFVYALVYFGLRKGRIPGTSEAFLPSVEGVPDGRESQKNVEPPEASSWDGLSAWVERFRIKDVGYSAVALPSLGLFLLVAFRDTQPFLSALFWYWGICCLALPGVVHERPSANFFEWAGSCLLRTIIFFVAGVLGSVIFSLFWGGVMKGSIDDAFPVGFVLATLPTLLIPNRFDILLPAALAALFTARGMTTSRSAGLCPRCQGTGYCYVCRGRGAHGGAQCAACLATGMCGECSGTGGRSVL